MSGRRVSPLDLVEEIYAAAEDPSLWNRFLQRLTTALGATLGALVFEDLRQHTARVAEITGRFHPDLVEGYQTYYAARNPWMERGSCDRRFLAGEVLTGQQLLRDSELVRTEYYNDFLQRSNLHHLIGAVLISESGAVSQLSILRPRNKGAFGLTERTLLETLTPHLRRALRIHQKLAHLAGERDAIGEALDRVPVGVLVVDRAGKPLRINRAGSEILDARDGLFLRADGFAAARTSETEALRRAIALAGAASGEPPSGGVLSLSRPSGRRALSVIVSPLLSRAGEFGVDAPAVVVFVTDPDRRVEAPEVWRRLYGFTPAETSLACRLAGGTDLATAAEELAVTVGTARVQLKSLLAKTDTHRQAELVRMLLLSGEASALVPHRATGNRH